jgi:hypothetical protein
MTRNGSVVTRLYPSEDGRGYSNSGASPHATHPN